MKIELESYNSRINKDSLRMFRELLSFRMMRKMGYFNVTNLKEIAENWREDWYAFRILWNGNFVGAIAINYERKKKSWNLSYLVFKEYYNRGIATLAVKNVLAFASKKKIKHIHAETMKDNLSSMKVLEKNHFKKMKEKGNEVFWEKKL